MKNDVIRIIAIMIALLVVLNYQSLINAIIHLFKALIPMLLGIVFAIILNKPYEIIKSFIKKQFNIKDSILSVVSLAIVYILLIVFFILIISIVVPEFVGNIHYFTTHFESYMGELQLYINDLCHYIHIPSFELSMITEKLTEYLSQLTQYFDTIIPYIVTGATTIINFIANGAITIVFSIYLLSGKYQLKSQFKCILKTYLPASLYPKIRYLLLTTYHVFDNYFVGQVIEAIILGCLCFIGMIILGIEYAGLISVVIALTALIPVFGAYFSGAICFILLLLIKPIDAIIFLIYLVILQQIEGNVIYPRVVGHKIGLPAIRVLFGVTVGGKLMRIIGMFVGIPITTLVYTLIKNDIYKKQKEKYLYLKE